MYRTTTTTEARPAVNFAHGSAASDYRLLNLGRRSAGTRSGCFSGRQMGGRMIVPTPLIAIAAITLAAAGSLNPALAVVIVLFAAAVAAIGTVVMRFHNANMQRLCGRGVEVFPSAVALGKPRSASSYVAICRCNWTGHEQDTPQSAEVDAFRHANGAPVHVHAGPA